LPRSLRLDYGTRAYHCDSNLAVVIPVGPHARYPGTMPPKRVNVSSRNKDRFLHVSALISLLLVSACNWGYGAPVDRAKFASAILHEDGTRCVFTLHDAVYRPAEGMRAFPDGGVPRYDIDRHKIGIVDLDTAETSVLVDNKNRHWLDGHGGFHLVGLRGRWALLRQAGQRPNYEPDHRWLKLDLESGDLEELALDAEMSEKNRQLGRAEIADDAFTLILVTKKDSNPQEIWARSANGTLENLARTDHYYGTAEGQIWWYDVGARAGARTNYKTGTTILERRANFAMPRKDPIRRCQASFDGAQLIHQYKVDGSWKDEALPLRASELR
jgi:hypothetical protein